MDLNLGNVTCELLQREDAAMIGNVLDELEMDTSRLSSFLEYPQNLAFAAKFNGIPVGFAYGYSLMPLDSGPQLFVYSIDVLPKYQNKGIGSRLFRFVADYAKASGFSECFVVTDKGNRAACRIYEKAGGKNDYEDEIVYVIKF